MFTKKTCRFGYGLFATRNIPKGKKILTISGKSITQAEVDRRPYKEAEKALQIKKFLYRDFEKPGVLVNHSCNPNAGIKEDRFLIAIRNIAKGEEITWDYSTSVDTAWTMLCKCRKKNCRKEIKDFFSLPKETQEKYLHERIVLGYIAKRCSK